MSASGQLANLCGAQQARWYSVRHMSIAHNLKALRKARGLSQTALAEKAGVGQQLISQIERGENTTTKKLPEIAKALGCQIYEIDPNYRSLARDEESPMMAKFTQIVGANDEEQLRLLDEYLDFLLARRQGHGTR